jgi:hypothetical protein
MRINQETLQVINRCFMEFYSARKSPGLQFASSYRGEIEFIGERSTQKLEFRLAPYLPARVQELA